MIIILFWRELTMSRTKLAMDDDFLYYDDSDYYNYHNQYDQYHSTPKTRCNYDSKMADESIKHCTKCNKCFERTVMRNYRKKNKIVIFYDDFPTFGKEKETCVVCSGGEYQKIMYGDIFCYKIIEPRHKVFGDDEHKNIQNQLEGLSISS